MKLDAIRNEYHFYTGKISEITRQLAFAGIALIWIFKSDQNAGQKIPQQLICPAVCLVMCLLCDFLQYLYGAVAYWWRYESAELAKKREGLSDDTNFKVSKGWILRPMDWLFCFKAAFLILAYVVLVVFLAKHVSG